MFPSGSFKEFFVSENHHGTPLFPPLPTTSIQPPYSNLPIWFPLSLFLSPYFPLFPYGLCLTLLYLLTTHHSFPVPRTMMLDVLCLCWYPITFTFLIRQYLSANHIYFHMILMIVGFLLCSLLCLSWESNTVHAQGAFSIYNHYFPGDSL